MGIPEESIQSFVGSFVVAVAFLAVAMVWLVIIMGASTPNPYVQIASGEQHGDAPAGQDVRVAPGRMTLSW